MPNLKRKKLLFIATIMSGIILTTTAIAAVNHVSGYEQLKNAMVGVERESEITYNQFITYVCDGIEYSQESYIDETDT